MTSPLEIHVAVQALMGGAAVLVAAEKVRGFFRESPVPAETYETKESAKQMANELRARLAEVEARQDQSRTTRESDRKAAHDEMAEMRAEMKEDIRSVQERVDAVAPQIAQLQKQVGEDFRAVHQRVDNLPAQLVTLLRNTGALK